MNTSATNYLRTHRRRSGLSQVEVAFLLGLKSGQIVSRYERLDRTPSLETALACQVLFGALPHELYPGLYAKVENITRRRIHALLARMTVHSNETTSAFKRETLKRAIERTDQRRPQSWKSTNRESHSCSHFI